MLAKRQRVMPLKFVSVAEDGLPETLRLVEIRNNYDSISFCSGSGLPGKMFGHNEIGQRGHPDNRDNRTKEASPPPSPNSAMFRLRMPYNVNLTHLVHLLAFRSVLTSIVPPIA